MAQDFVHSGLIGASFDDVARLRDAGALFEAARAVACRRCLFVRTSRRGRYILYNVGPLTTRGKLDVISIGRDPDDAMYGVRELFPKLLGL